jgi:hypothetical protein
MMTELFNRNIIGIHAEIDVPVRVYGQKYGTPEYWRALERDYLSESKDLVAFIRDHRSRDHYDIQIIKEYNLTCKFCGREFPDEFNGIADCCTKMIEAQGIKIEDL